MPPNGSKHFLLIKCLTSPHFLCILRAEYFLILFIMVKIGNQPVMKHHVYLEDGYNEAIPIFVAMDSAAEELDQYHCWYSHVHYLGDGTVATRVEIIGAPELESDTIDITDVNAAKMALTRFQLYLDYALLRNDHRPAFKYISLTPK